MNPADPVALAAALIRRPSVTPLDAGAQDVLAEALAGLGFAVTRLRFGEIDNLYARIGAGAPHFAFAGHTDVVPPGSGAGAGAWSFDPFGAVVQDGRLYGRGAVDMKGAIAAFLAATEDFLAAKGGQFDGSISVLLTGDEEGAAKNGTRKVLEWLETKGERLDACLLGEPTSEKALGDVVKIGRRGSLNARLHVFGVQGHTAYPHLADNAAHRLLRLLTALLRSELDQGSEHFAPSSLQISTIDVGNPASNVIPAKAEAVFNVRFNDLWTGESLERELRARLDAEGGRYALDVALSGEAFLTPRGALADRVAEAIRRVTGIEPRFGTGGGTSDARFIKALCPVVEFGLVGLFMHKIDEKVPLAELALLSEIYRNFLEIFFAAP